MIRDLRVSAQSAQSLRALAKSFPQSLAIASDLERITKIEFSEMVNAYAKVLSRLPKSSSFLPVLVSTNINSVILYHAAILSRTPVALIDGSTAPVHLAKILAKLGKPEFAVVTAPEFSKLLHPTLKQITIGRERELDFEIPEVGMNESAIVIFSSGSSGESKGVIWSWKNVDESFKVMSSYYLDRKDLNLGRVTSIAYASGAYQMLSAAANHNLHIINPQSSPDQVIDFVNKNKLRQLSFSSSFAERIYDQRSIGKVFHDVEEILTYGESVSWEQVRKIRELTDGKAEIRVSYGASESPGFVIYFVVKPETPLGIGRVPIGHLNQVENLTLMPNPEDATIASVVINHFVAKEYLNDVDLTTQKFKVGVNGQRFYQTSDLVRVDEDGLISFLGRGDDLVKINGRLVGPSESEELLRLLPGIVSVAVLPHITISGKHYLAAHLVLSQESQLTPTKVYEFLLEKLSSHLVPTQLIRHIKLPLNSNGKIDRLYLQKQKWPRWKDRETARLPSTFESFTLYQLRRILNTPDLTLTEDIFGCGMDSLAAVEFQTIAEDFGYGNVKPPMFLEHRNVQSIALFLARGKPSLESNFISLNKSGSASPFFIFPGAGVSAIFFKGLADTLGVNQPLIVIEPQGMHTSQPVQNSLEEMALSAATEIVFRVPNGSIRLIGHSAGSAIACETGLILHSMGRKVSMVSLDSAGIANGVSMTSGFFRIHALYRRVGDIVTRSPQSVMKSIRRRHDAITKNSYEFFILHIGKLSIKYKFKIKPLFPIHFLYCAGRKGHSYWIDNHLFTFRKIQGQHLTMLNEEYLGDVASKIQDYFAKQDIVK